MATSIPASPEIVSRKKALELGLARYFTGKPCKQGHIAERNTVRKGCLECERIRRVERYWRDPAKENARRKATRQASPEKHRAYSRAYSAVWKRNNPEKVNAQNRAWREKHPEKAKLFRLRWEEKHKQRMKDDPEYALAQRQKGKAKQWNRKEKLAGRPRMEHCEICGKLAEEICYDHCHESGKFRGWLCHECNWVLGFANDSPELLRKLAQYLEKHKQPS